MTTTTAIQCRQCGHQAPRDDFPTGDFKCPSCNWTEILSPATGLKGKRGGGPKASGNGRAANDDGGPPSEAAPEAEESVPEAETAAGDEESAPQADAPAGGKATDPVHEALAQGSPEDFVLWCGRMFERFGYSVQLPDDMDDRECDLEISRGGERALVLCRAMDRDVRRTDCQQLVGAIIGRKMRRGIVVTTRAFADGCRAYVAALPDLRFDLIDGAELEETIRLLSTGPLRKWN